MRTIDLMTPRELQDLRDAGRGHLIDGIGPLLEKADAMRKEARETTAQADAGSPQARPDCNSEEVKP